MRILIAEDDFTSRTILVEMLKKQGHEVIVTMNGMEAWNAILQSDAPRLVILDWMMPELDGVDVCRRIRDIKTDQPPYIIMLTGRNEMADIVAGLTAGADDYMAKPFDPGELKARIGVGQRVLKLQQAIAQKVNELETALSQVKLLQGIIPICSTCHKIRTDQECWEQMEKYITEHSAAKFSHSICPDCMKKLYQELSEDERGADPE